MDNRIGIAARLSRFTFSSQRLAPLARKSRAGVPAVAMWLQLAFVAALLLTATFDQIINYVQFSLTLCSMLAVIGVFVLRVRQPDLPRPYRTWGYPVTPLIFLAISAWMLIFTWQQHRNESLAGLGTLLLGLILYFVSPRTKPDPSSP